MDAMLQPNLFECEVRSEKKIKNIVVFGKKKKTAARAHTQKILGGQNLAQNRDVVPVSLNLYECPSAQINFISFGKNGQVQVQVKASSRNSKDPDQVITRI